jgi:xylan 1,4-beta-xylosidase
MSATIDRASLLLWTITLAVSCGKRQPAKPPQPGGSARITVNAASVIGPLTRPWQTVVGSDHAAMLLRDDLLAHVKDGHDHLGISYVRAHGIFHDDVGVYTEDESGRPIYDFSRVDAIYARLLSVGVKPFVELSFMPKALSTKPTTVFHYRGNTSPPKSMERWEDLVERFARHCEERFGQDEVRSWFFEVWNEPNIDFWEGNQAQYFELYDASARALKKVDPHLRVGGPVLSTSRRPRRARDERYARHRWPRRLAELSGASRRCGFEPRQRAGAMGGDG